MDYIELLENPFFLFGIAVVAMVELVLKGFALWRAGRNNQSGWFIAILVLNTVGILPILYIAFFQKKTA